MGLFDSKTPRFGVFVHEPNREPGGYEVGESYDQPMRPHPTIDGLTSGFTVYPDRKTAQHFTHRWQHRLPNQFRYYEVEVVGQVMEGDHNGPFLRGAIETDGIRILNDITTDHD